MWVMCFAPMPEDHINRVVAVSATWEEAVQGLLLMCELHEVEMPRIILRDSDVDVNDGRQIPLSVVGFVQWADSSRKVLAETLAFHSEHPSRLAPVVTLA